MRTPRSLGFLWIYQWDSQSNVAFSVSVTVKLCPSMRATEDLGGLKRLLKTVSKNPLLSPFHTKLVQMTNLVKALDKNVTDCQQLCTLFPSFNSAKLKDGISIGAQIREALHDKVAEELLTLSELREWEAFRSLWHDFFWQHTGTRLPSVYREFVTCL